ncbi:MULTISPECIES: glycosyltransferase [unclassified Halomonas]|uniref:glycosyltransferase n=1 Tax=unclassified Halomonas TaxID=2609666 RepID=UPI0020769D50|nr:MULTISPECIES: glycosyltransferase [unclassified Halomonas]
MVSGKRWSVLSDGAKPTEDVYVLASAAPRLDARVRRVTASRSKALAWWQRWRYLSRLNGHHLIVCRSLSATWIEWLERYRHRLGSIVYLIDDDIPAAAADSQLPPAYRERMASIAALQPRLFALADTVVACSPQLKRCLATAHTNVQVLTPPLLAPLPSLAHFESAPSRETPWRIGFHGTRAHLSDLEHIALALVELQTGRRDTELEIMLGSYTPSALAKLPRVETPKPLGWPAFQTYQRSRRLHIGLSPLWGSPFNAGKSFIKFLDIAAMGGVGVYSNRYPYTEVVRHGENGLLVEDDANQWHAAISYLLDNPRDAARMAHQASIDASNIGDPARAADFWANF